MTSWSLTAWATGARQLSSVSATPTAPTIFWWRWPFRRCSICCVNGADNIHGGRLPHHVRVLWDEAANTGQVPNLEKLVAVIRSREVSLTLFYQQLAQCKAIYDKNAETILGNMDSVVFLGGRESSTIKEISENWLGKATISMQTDGRTRGQSESYSQNNQRLGRELMTPSELATMPGQMHLAAPGPAPVLFGEVRFEAAPQLKYTAEADKQKNAFSLDKLINRRAARAGRGM